MAGLDNVKLNVSVIRGGGDNSLLNFRLIFFFLSVVFVMIDSLAAPKREASFGHKRAIIHKKGEQKLNIQGE